MSNIRLAKNIISIASKIRCKLSPIARERIIEAYEKMREKEDDTFVCPVTPRSLDAIIRLSKSVCKLRLSTTVCIEDVNEAISVIEASLKISLGMSENSINNEIDNNEIKNQSGESESPNSIDLKVEILRKINWRENIAEILGDKDEISLE